MIMATMQVTSRLRASRRSILLLVYGSMEWDALQFPFLLPRLRSSRVSVSKAPFGRGENTLVDITIRNALQLSPDQFQLKNTGRLLPWNGQVL